MGRRTKAAIQAANEAKQKAVTPEQEKVRVLREGYDCFAQVKYPDALLAWMQTNKEDWYTKDKTAARTFENYLESMHLGYSKRINLSWGFQATFTLHPEGNPWT